MKHLFLIFLTLFICELGHSQSLLNDSLQGFDEAKIAVLAHQENLKGEEFKFYLDRVKREYIKKKFSLQQIQIGQLSVSKKYGLNTTSNYPCLNEGFDGLSPGLLSNLSGWIADQTQYQSYICTTSLIPMYTNSTAVFVYSMPLTAGILGTINASPFGGGRLAKINNTGFDVARISQNFSVTSGNFYYNYAYKGVLSGPTHGCCGDPYLMFRFYDCGGSLISSLSHTVVLGTPSCVSTSTTNWAASTASPGLSYTPNWEVFTLNLGAYLGSCITVEVIASSCIYGAEYGYMYYDADCSEGGLTINGDYLLFNSVIPSYTSCTIPATVSAFPGATSYTWQGPAASGISSLSNSTFTTNVSGVYTLTTLSGTLTSSHIVYLSVSPTISLTLPNSICSGQAATVQASGSGVSSYSWSTGSAQSAIFVAPNVTTSFSLTATDTFGCVTQLSATLNVLPLTVINVVSSTFSICLGQSLNLSATAPGITSFSWSTGPVNSTLAISPTITTVYTVSVTGLNGCLSSESKTIIVFNLPQLQVVASSLSLCSGQSVILTATGSAGNSYKWSSGASSFSIGISPSLTSVFSVTATGVAGCTVSTSQPITVYPLPQIQIIASATAICLGQSANFGVTGSNISTVLWNTGAASLVISVSPSINSVYSTTVNTSFGCPASQSISLLVNPLPQAQITASSLSICVGESATLSVNGINLVSYHWLSSEITPSISVSPSITTQYSVTFTDSKGCSAASTLQLLVVECIDLTLGMHEFKPDGQKFVIFPNPTSGNFEVKGYKNAKGLVVNDLGQVIMEFYLNAENNYSYNVTNLAKGIYFITNSNSSERVMVLVK